MTGSGSQDKSLTADAQEGSGLSGHAYLCLTSPEGLHCIGAQYPAKHTVVGICLNRWLTTILRAVAQHSLRTENSTPMSPETTQPGEGGCTAQSCMLRAGLPSFQKDNGGRAIIWEHVEQL